MQEITTKFLNQKITFSLNEDKFNIFFGENARGGSVIFEEKEISENLLLRKLCMDNNVPDFVGYLADKYTLETKLYELKKISNEDNYDKIYEITKLINVGLLNIL